MKKLISIALIGILSMALGGCALRPLRVEVPEVVGMRHMEAAELIESKDLVAEATEGEAAATDELEYIVYEQDPAAGIKILKGTMVALDYYGECIEPVRPQRIMSIMWMGDERWIDEFGGTHIVGFTERANPGWYDDSHPIKLIMYFKTNDIDYIRSEVRRWKDDPNNGGYWLISGHEPDITGNEPTIEANRQLRIAQYEAIREEDPDAWNHPVVIFYDMTSGFGWDYPGWEEAFPMPEEGVDCDVFIIDCYANNEDGSVDYKGMRIGGRLAEIGLARSGGQFIPNFGCAYEPGQSPSSLVAQFEWWDEWYGERHDGEGLKSVAIWFAGPATPYNGVYDSEYLQEEAREINRRLGLIE